MDNEPERTAAERRALLVSKVEHDAAGAVGGAAAGTVAGMLAGPAGMIAGAVAGALAGAVATEIVERDHDAIAARTTQLEVRRQEQPRGGATAPTSTKRIAGRVGAFSAASMGVSTESHLAPAEGPMPPPSD